MRSLTGRSGTDMKEEDEIMQCRQHAPEAVRVLVELARETDDASVRKEAISQLVARRFLFTHQPTDDDLWRIENMTDEEIKDTFRRASY